MFRCIGCGANLETAAALASNRDKPLACAGCGVRQHAPRVQWPAVIAAAIVFGFAAAWLPVAQGPDALMLWLASMMATLAVERFVAFRRGSMRAWTWSSARAWAWVVFDLGLGTAFAVLAALALTGHPRGLADRPMARVEGIVEQVWGGDCLCVTLVGRPDRFGLGSAHARRLMGKAPPAGLRPGASVTLHVPAEDLATPPSDGPRRVAGLRIGDDILFAPRDVAAWEQGKRRVLMFGGVIGMLIFAFAAWRQRQSIRADAAYAAAHRVPSVAAADLAAGRRTSGNYDAN